MVKEQKSIISRNCLKTWVNEEIKEKFKKYVVINLLLTMNLTC